MKSWLRPPARVRVRPQDKDNDSSTRLRIFFETLIKINKRTQLLKSRIRRELIQTIPDPVVDSFERIENKSIIKGRANSGKRND